MDYNIYICVCVFVCVCMCAHSTLRDVPKNGEPDETRSSALMIGGGSKPSKPNMGGLSLSFSPSKPKETNPTDILSNLIL